MKTVLCVAAVFLQSMASTVVAQKLGTPADPYTLAYLGSTINVIVASAVGVIGGFAHKSEPHRYRMFSSVAIYSLLAAAAVTLIPAWWGWVIDPTARPPLALVFGFASRFLIPVLTEHGPALFKSLLVAWVTRAGQATPPPRQGDEP